MKLPSSAPQAAGGRFRPASPWIAMVLGALILVPIAVVVPVSEVGHRDVLSNLANPLPLAFAGVGLLIALKRPRNSIGWVLLAGGGFASINSTASLYSVVAYRDHHSLPLAWLAVLLQVGWAPAIVLFGVAIQFFPSGRLPPGRWRWVFWAFIGVGWLWATGAFAIALTAVLQNNVHPIPSGDLVQIVNPTGAAALWGVLQAVFFPLFGLMLLAWFARELPAFRRSTGEHQQQLKWLAGGTLISVVGGALSVFVSGKQGIWGTVATAGGVALTALPISVGMGVLKYHLYEMVRPISRTISYLVVTGLMVGVCAGSVLLATRVLPFSSPVAVAGSTLAAAALFNPLRRRIQKIVDHRFNRTHSDAEAAISAFTARLRDAVDIDTTRGELLNAVNHSLAPAHASLWIRSGDAPDSLTPGAIRGVGVRR